MSSDGVSFANGTKHGSTIGYARTHPGSAAQHARFQDIYRASLQAAEPHDSPVRVGLTGYSPSAATPYSTGATQGSSHHATRAPPRRVDHVQPRHAAHIPLHSVTQAPSQHGSSTISMHPLFQGNRVHPDVVKKNYDDLAVGGGMQRTRPLWLGAFHDYPP